MHHDQHQAGTTVPSDDSPPERDPMDAVLAVAEPREEAGKNDEAVSSPDGVLTDAPRNDAMAKAPADDEAGYGDFAWPDGYVADPKALAKFVPVAKKLGLDKNGAQELAGLYAELDRDRQRDQAEFIAKNNAEWLREIQNHPEFGGARLERTGEEVAAVMRRFGSPLLTAQIRQMNVQNWPEMFYFLARVSAALSEDCSPASAGGGAPEKSAAQLLFPGLK